MTESGFLPYDFETTAERDSIGNDRANFKIIKRKNLVVYDDLT